MRIPGPAQVNSLQFGLKIAAAGLEIGEVQGVSMTGFLLL